MKRPLAAALLLPGIFACTGCETLLGPESTAPLSQAPPPLEQPYDLLVRGEPDATYVTVQGGYYIWKEGNVWHLRGARPAAGPGDNPFDYFTGSISMDGGYISNVLASRNLQPPDDLTSYRSNIEYRFQSLGELKGFDFAVQPVMSEYCLNFDLRLNNAADPAAVHLGNSMAPVASMPARICFTRPYN